MTWGRDLAVSAVVAAAAGSVAYVGVHAAAATDDVDIPPPGDRVQHAIDAFRAGDRVHVAADGHDLLAPEAEAHLQELSEASSVPVFIAVWEPTGGDAGYEHEMDAADELGWFTGEQGVYVVYTGPEDSAAEDWPRRYDVTIPDDFHGDPVRRLEELITAVDGAELRAPRDPWDYWGGPWGAVAAGFAISLGTVPAALLLLALGWGLSRAVRGAR